MTKASLIQELESFGLLTESRLKKAFQDIDRADFVSPEFRSAAYFNIPLPIGHNQTISQPLTVAFMLHLLEPKPGQTILDVGSGSGWQTALLAHIVSATNKVTEKPGHIVALEIMTTLCATSAQAINKYNYLEHGIVEIHCRNAEGGFPDRAPYDRIIAAASLSDIPHDWHNQLKVNGIMVAPIGQSIIKWVKNEDGTIIESSYPGFVFVPFISKT